MSEVSGVHARNAWMNAWRPRQGFTNSGGLDEPKWDLIGDRLETGLGQNGVLYIFSVCSSSKFSKSVNSFGPGVFFPSSIRLRLSIGEVVAQNEFATKALTCTTGSVTMM